MKLGQLHLCALGEEKNQFDIARTATTSRFVGHDDDDESVGSTPPLVVDESENMPVRIEAEKVVDNKRVVLGRLVIISDGISHQVVRPESALPEGEEASDAVREGYGSTTQEMMHDEEETLQEAPPRLQRPNSLRSIYGDALMSRGPPSPLPPQQEEQVVPVVRAEPHQMDCEKYFSL